MGLLVSHGAFNGSYTAFDRFRDAICQAIGGKWAKEHGDPWYWGEGYSKESHPGLHAFLCHSDCDGELTALECALLADELEAILPELDKLGMGAGHIERDGGYAAIANRFIEACRLAHKQGESLVFH